MDIPAPIHNIWLLLGRASSSTTMCLPTVSLCARLPDACSYRAEQSRSAALRWRASRGREP